MNTKFIFLGTGTSQGVPTIGCKCDVCTSSNTKDKRLRSSVYIEYEGLKVVIDAGPDFRQQLLRENIDYLDAVILTHNHKDHTGGLDDVRAFNYLYNKDFPLYAENYVFDSLKKEYYYVFAENKYPGIPEFEINTISNIEFYIKGIKITPIRAFHNKLPVLGYRIGDIAYITDASFIPEEEFQKLKGLKLFVINAVRIEKHLSHFSLPEAIEVCQKVKAEKSYITHISHQMGKHDDIVLPPRIELSFDGLKLFS